MVSWLTWPVDWLALKFSGRRIEEIKKSLGSAGYVDDELWSRVRQISEKQAHEELERGVKIGYLERMLLYNDEPADISFVVPEESAGQKVSLSGAGYFSDDEVTISKYLKRVYVAAATGQQAITYAAETA